MAPEEIFKIANMIAMLGWIILIVLPGWLSSDKFIIGIIITLFAIVYSWLLFNGFHPADAAKFGSLGGVMQLFQKPVVVTAGWIHYLAFDLLTGLFISRNSKRHGISHWIIIPCLLLTFMFGPAGLLLYLLIRLIVAKNYFATNF